MCKKQIKPQDLHLLANDIRANAIDRLTHFLIYTSDQKLIETPNILLTMNMNGQRFSTKKLLHYSTDHIIENSTDEELD